MNTSLFIPRFRNLAAVSLLGFTTWLGGCGEMVVNTQASRDAGIKQYNAGDYANAAGTFRTTLRANPSDYGSCYFVGACLAKMGGYEQAIQKYKATLIMMDNSVIGRSDRRFRLQCLNSLAEAFVASKDRNIQSVLNSGSPPSESQFILAKINRGWGDADAAIEAYSQASRMSPQDFDIAKEYGLYLLQLGQTEQARGELRRAYAMKTDDEQLTNGLRRVGIVPGPSLKDSKDMVRPVIPLGPIPEVEITVLPASDRPSGTPEQ